MTQTIDMGDGYRVTMLDLDTKLTEQQILDAGWIKKESMPYLRQGILCFEKNNVWLMIHRDSNASKMMLRDPSKQMQLLDLFNQSTIFVGYIYDIDTLLQLEKILII